MKAVILRRFLFLISACVLGQLAYARSAAMQGQAVSRKENEPLIGVTVLAKDKNQGAQTFLAQARYAAAPEARPAIIPLPQQLKWSPGNFPLQACKKIVVKDNTLRQEAERLRQILLAHGVPVEIAKAVRGTEPFIELRIARVKSPRHAHEAYQLHVSARKVELAANTAQGIFNGMQTFAQLIQDNKRVNACQITDWPAYSWRGYMVDVGRNFQPVALLKQQIDKMARYKLNIFHFHLTEDIAWRLQIPKYPQLTAPEHMLRNKGAYYSVAELKDLIAYCRDRHITLVPEIDVPGHSAAFTRAMGIEMQSEKGLALIKEILTDICRTYQVPYIHLGGDEVKNGCLPWSH
jgi:hexosaminidase